MSKFINKQAGGTLLGLIFGLIIGLAIAVVVAIMITKTPTPFTNKTVKADKPPEAITTPAAPAAGGDQLPDPNKALYGNQSAAKEAAKAFTPPATPALPPTDGTPAAVSQAAEKKLDALVAKSQDNKPAPVVDKSTADKAKKLAGDIAEAKTKAAAADDNWIYFLQVGAFREQNEAESAKARLALMGFEAKISERQADTGSLYRVRVGPFNQLETMNRIRGKLSDNGVNAAVVRAAK